MSFVAWLDHSEQERRRALDVINMFREQGTVDELGIGTIRDAFARLFFPGTSTIQTRARYFLFIPWIYLELERRRVRSAEVARWARRYEVRLIEPLARSEDSDGTIGVDAGKALKRLPSDVYWVGLQTWGIRLLAGSQDQYHRSLDGFYSRAKMGLLTDDHEPADGQSGANWHLGIPPAPPEFPDEVSMSLRRIDAEYLRERILSFHPGTVLAFLADQGQLSSVLLPWEHPLRSRLPNHLAGLMAHAQRFSEAMHGAALLYNVMLAEASPNEELREQYQGGLEAWEDRMKASADVFGRWDRSSFWDIVHEHASVNSRRDAFVNAWLDLALPPAPPLAMQSNKAARQIIRERERVLKGARARLYNERALALWGGASGAEQLDYRWSVTQRIVNDILEGLASGA